MGESMESNIGKEIAILARQFNKYIARELQGQDILTSEYIFIASIEEDKQCNQQDICNLYSIDKSVATRATESLVRKGFIERLKNPHDKREHILKLTDKGKEVKPFIVDRLSHWTDIISKELNEDEVELVSSIIRKMRIKALEENSNVKK
jgi:DNA-binding MarR family transcriptional regulator